MALWSMHIGIRRFQAFAPSFCETDVSISRMKEGVGVQQYNLRAVQVHSGS